MDIVTTEASYIVNKKYRVKIEIEPSMLLAMTSGRWFKLTDGLK